MRTIWATLERVGIMAPEEDASRLSERLAQLRQTVFGPRGRAAFSRALGISPSTYNYYEKGRQPPADLLAKAAQYTGADLKWLMTGDGQPFSETPTEAGDIQLTPQAREILGRLSANLSAAADPDAARGALAAILARMEEAFPPSKDAWHPATAPLKPTAIPIVGRTAAGLLASWEEHFADEGHPDVMERLISQVETRAARQRGAELKAADATGQFDAPRDSTALLVQLSEPTPEGIVEFLDLPGLGPIEPGTFALRVDGDSMAPRILDGDIVVCRRDAAPRPGQTAVVKISGRIGLAVKLWRPEGDHVHLIPINETHNPNLVLRTDVLWACPVVWVVRP